MTYSSAPNPRRVQSILLKPNSGYRGPNRIRWGYHVLMQQALELQLERERTMARLYGREEGDDPMTAISDMRRGFWNDEQDEVKEEEEKRRHEEFVRKRKLHYQMGDVLKQYQAKDD